MKNIYRYGVTVIGWSSDGDPKLLATMCYETVHQCNDIACVQDTIHIATKLRNRLLKPDIELSMGSKKVTVKHLKSLVKNVNKSIHGLNESDVCPIDRQNFQSFQKIVDARVIEALRTRINNSEATVQYLRICDEITSSFLDLQLRPEERIFRMFHALYFLRIWRNHIRKSRHHTLKNDFITHNAYTCIEINARSMIQPLKRFRDQNASDLFLLGKFDSQTCEKTFRQLRSMGTVDFTRINFSLYDLLHMIGRIEVQNDITYFKLADTGVTFPSSHKKAKKTQIFELPTDPEIEKILEQAKQAAIHDANRFEMDPNDIDVYQLQSNISIDENDDENIYDDDDVSSSMITESLDIEESDQRSNLTSVIDENGDERVVRKSTLVWMLTEPGAKLSKDRLRRVQLGKRIPPTE